MYRTPELRTAVIAIGQTTSNVIDLRDYVLVGVITPVALTGTAITFEAAPTTGGTYVPVYDSNGNIVSLAVAADRAVGLSGDEADALSPWQHVKLVSGSAEAAERTLTLVLK